MHRTTPPRFDRKLLAIAIGAALAPHGAWAVDLVQAPPGTVQPYVTPNVIISIDDSGSMNYRVDSESSSGATNGTTPNADGSWPGTSRRMNVLKYALKSIFDPTHPKYDSTLLPDNKIRLAWQAMWNNGQSPGVGAQWKSGSTTSYAGANSVDSGTLGVNSMKVLEGAHRTNFLSFVNSLSASGGTPSHLMFAQADAYMRRSLSKNGPWASIPGSQDTPYLGCRRNYHIFMTDGRWNGSVSGGTQDDNTKNVTLPNGTVFGSTNAASRPKNDLYADTYSNTLADWSFKSWSTKLQTAMDVNGVTGLKGTPQPTAEYNKAPATEDFGKDSTGKDAILDRFWNPRYNPADWPHMVTYTIGMSKMAYTWPGDRVPGANTPSSPATVCTVIKAPGQGCVTNVMASTATFNTSLMVPFSYDKGFNGSLPDFITGNIKWPNLSSGGETVRSLDLWHAALNGRGRFYAVEKGEDLAKAFRDIFQQINTLVDPNLTSTATSGSNISRNDVGKFTGNYEPKNAWKGFVTAETVQKDGTTVPTTAWGGKNTADKLDAMDINSRLILSWSDQWVTSKEKGGVTFKWDSGQNNLSTAQKALLGKDPSDSTVTVATNAENRLNFIRGDQSKEGSETNGYTSSKPMRERKSRQGDIVNSVVWYTGAPASNYALKGYSAFTLARKSRTPMIYVGGNDGLLHGFSAADGTEQIAYAPRGVIANLPLLTDPAYNNKHKFFVDGSPMTGDVDLGAPDPADPSTTIPDWRTVLVGTMGAGGKGYFVLDVTNPASTDVGTLPGFTEGNAQKLVMLDRTRGAEPAPNCAAMTGAQQTACNTAEAEDKDIGYITARPVLDESNPMRTTQITRMNNNRWAVVMGNGYNSANQRPVLLIQYLDGNKELKRISAAAAEAVGTGNANDNGLSAPRLVDLNGDNRVDIAYAGDNLGNLWKFDLTNASDIQWNVAFGGQPLFTATGPASLGSARTQTQRITAAPTVRANDRTMVVGTGTSAKTISVGGMMVAFGTGRNVTKADENDAKVQTLYSVLDNTRYRIDTTTNRLEVHPGAGTCSPVPAANCVPTPKALGTGVVNAKLALQSITDVGTSGYASVDVTDELKKETWANYNGWYMDLPAVGERLLKPLEFYDGSNILAMYSQVPAKGSNVDPNVESCESTTVDDERQYLTLVNIMDGKRPTVQLMDYDGNGMFYSQPGSSGGCATCGDDKLVSRMPVAPGSHTLIKKGGSGDCLNYDIDVKNNKINLACMPEQSLRPSWRQLK